ncbi:MAG TPA: metal ABC transporter permease [Candidatus Saccharimonadales bacterium]|nr:metal ABC transporter permease [Candidatus Saccharimonadales bacterium]
MIDQTLLLIMFATGLLAINAGIMGCFVLLQRKSLFGDTIAHATLPGIAGIFLILHSKLTWILMMGGMISASIGAITIHYIIKQSTLKKDTALGIVLATSFGFGTALLSKIQTYPTAHQAGITKYLLGNASTILYSDLYMIAAVSIINLICLKLFFKEYCILLFNPDYAHTIGIPVQKISMLITLKTMLTIVVGLQTVGVILISALLIAPAAAARQWTQQFSTMIFLSACFAILSTTTGTLISSFVNHLPTGPTIVVIATLITFLSILFSPQGVVTSWITKKHHMKKIHASKMLSHFMLFNESKTDPYHAHDIKALQAIGKQSTKATLRYLEKEGLIEQSHQKNFFRLTPKGFSSASHQHKELS